MLVYAYKKASKSARALAKGLGAKRIKHEGSKLVGRASKVVINWGASALPPEVSKCTVLNKPESVATSCDKLAFHKTLGGIRKDGTRTLRYTTDRHVAEMWLDYEHKVIARQVLNGHSGVGIVVIDKLEDMVDAPLYTVFIDKTREFRIHIFRGEVVDIQEKKKKKDFPKEMRNGHVFNVANGYVFARNNLDPVPTDVFTQAGRAVDGLGLDFGGVDVLFDDKTGKAYVIEVNTACGLEGSTLEGYIERFKEL
jgi:glutathione synthase/RimK-type ligase-like ATP-grasp enzyme